MANAIWIEKESRWKIDATIDGRRRVFTSRKPGRTGKIEVNRKYQAWEDGESDRYGWTLEKCWNLFLQMIVDKHGKTESYVQNEMYGRLYLVPAFGKRKASSITLDEWQGVISTAKPVGKKRKDGTIYFQTKVLSKKTLMNLRNTILMFCRFARDRQMMEKIPEGLYIPVKAPTIGKTSLQPDQLKRLFEASQEWYINALRFEVLTGLRPGEVLGLQKADYKNGTVTIRRARNCRNIETHGKNENARRTIALHELAIREIELQLEKTSDFETEWIFCNSFGGPGTQKGAYNAWRRIAAERDLSGSPYGLRHTFVSMMQNDLPEQMVKAIVGHSASMDTYGIYAHAVTGDMEKSAKIQNIVFEKALVK